MRGERPGSELKLYTGTSGVNNVFKKHGPAADNLGQNGSHELINGHVHGPKNTPQAAARKNGVAARPIQAGGPGEAMQNRAILWIRTRT